MANPEHVEILAEGVEVWNEWRKNNPGITPDLSYAHIYADEPEHDEDDEISQTVAISNDAEISGLFYLRGIDLSNADLKWSEWVEVNLMDANLSGSNLFGADLIDCDLANADLSKAVLVWIEIRLCDLFGTDFNLCRCNQSSFLSVDLSEAIGLESIKHDGPSSIGVDTIFESSPEIPDSFLRGCGVPEDFIKLIPSLIAQPFEFYKCFISHSASDMDFCKRLHADLQNEGVRVWFFPEDARTGRGVWDEIDKSIKVYDKLMVVCSENSLTSGPVLREIERALQREDREHKHILFPIRIDDYIFDEWEHPRKADVIAKVVGDFSNWKDHDSYQKAFDRLMRDLKASETDDT